MLLLLACRGATTFIHPDPGGHEVGDVPIEGAGEVDDTEPDETGDPDDTGDVRDDAIYEAWFDRATLHDVRLTLSDDAVRDLRFDPFSWVHAGVSVDGVVYPDVGVRLKGSSSFQSFDGKPAFKVELDQYVAGERYGSLERLVLNNMVGDPAQGREILAYSLFQAAGLAAPRIAYARVYVNDELFGLYSSPEAMDEHWIRRRYDRDDRDGGQLWEANDYADFTRGGLRSWECAVGTGDTTRLEAVKAALVDPGDFLAEVGEVVDVDQFLAFWAMTLLVGNSDGYPYNLNDVYVYEDPSDGRIDFAPWGLDETWPDGFQWNGVGGEIALECLGDAGCVDALYAALDAAVVTYEQADPASWADEAWALTADAVVEDPRRPYSVEEVTAARAALTTTLTTWPETLRGQM